jgi:hypothetical protein
MVTRGRIRGRQRSQVRLMRRDTSSDDAGPMQLPESRIIVVRAWRDAGGLRVRLLTDGAPERQWVVGSIADARDVLGSLLAELLGAEADGTESVPAARQHGRPMET